MLRKSVWKSGVFGFVAVACFTSMFLGRSASLQAAGFGISDFGPRIDFPLGDTQEAIAAGDLDGDGKADIVAPTYNGTIYVYQNIGTNNSLSSGSFAQSLTLQAGGNVMGAVLGDVDGDGKLDIIVANRGGTLSVFRNISTGGSLGTNSFAARVSYAVGAGEIRSVGAADLDGDGHLDVAVLSYGNN